MHGSGLPCRRCSCVDGQASAQRSGQAAQAVATVVYPARSLAHIERAFQFPRDENPQAAADAVTAICTAVENLAAHPLIGRRVEAEIRELIISYGKTGYIALYRFVIPQDEVRILALRHQRELGFVP